MVDFNNIKFILQEREDGLAEITARFVIQTSAIIARKEEYYEIYKKEVKQQFIREVYGDLYMMIGQLEHIARRNLPSYANNREIDNVMDCINIYLGRKGICLK